MIVIVTVMLAAEVMKATAEFVFNFEQSLLVVKFLWGLEEVKKPFQCFLFKDPSIKFGMNSTGC